MTVNTTLHNTNVEKQEWDIVDFLENGTKIDTDTELVLLEDFFSQFYVFHDVNRDEAIQPNNTYEDDGEGFQLYTNDTVSIQNIEYLFDSQEQMDIFVNYVFQRRFEWSVSACLEASDAESVPAPTTTEAEDNSYSGFDSNSINSETTEQRRRLNEILDKIIGILSTQPITESDALLNSYSFCVRNSAKRPKVRHHTYKIFFDWLSHQLHSFVGTGADDSQKLFQLHSKKIQKLVLAGVTDVWSEIRKTCNARLGSIIQDLGTKFIIPVYTRLLEICESEQRTWQAKEGAVMVINTIIRNFHWEVAVNDPKHFAATIAAAPTNNEGNNVSKPLPRSNSDPTLSRTLLMETKKPNDTNASLATYYLKFGNEEFSALPDFIVGPIRHVLYKMLAHPQLSVREYATKAFWAFLYRTNFQETISCFFEVISKLAPPSDSATNENKMIRLKDAHEAEGLLGLCVQLVKKIPLKYLLSNWDRYFPTLDLYLAHPASTVRQMTSTIFQHLISKDVHPQIPLFRKCLKGLVSNWEPDTEAIHSQDKRADSILKRELKTAFGEPQTPHSNRNTNLEQLRQTTSTGDQSHDNTTGKTWEWMEGRLLAYELILSFLMYQNSQRVFPHVAANTPTKRNSPSALTSLQSSHHRRSSSCGLPHSSGPSSPLMTGDNFAGLSPSSAAELGDNPTMIPPRRTKSVEYTDTPSLLERLRNLPKSSNNNTSNISQDNTGSFDEFICLLQKIFWQVLESFTLSVWELRRMANQVLPLVTETFLWVRIDTLGEIWEQYLPKKDTLACFFSCLTLKCALWKSVLLEYLLSNYNSSPSKAIVTNSESRARIASVISSFASRLKTRFLPMVLELCHESKFDKISMLSVEILIISHSYFNSNNTKGLVPSPLPTSSPKTSTITALSQEEEHEHGCHIEGVIERLLLFHSHATSPRPLAFIEEVAGSIDRESSPSTANGSSPRSPSRPQSVRRQRIAKVDECLMIDRISKHLPEFVLQCKLEQMVPLLGLLGDYLLCRDEVDVQLCILEAVYRIINLPFSWLEDVTNNHVHLMCTESPSSSSRYRAIFPLSPESPLKLSFKLDSLFTNSHQDVGLASPTSAAMHASSTVSSFYMKTYRYAIPPPPSRMSLKSRVKPHDNKGNNGAADTYLERGSLESACDLCVARLLQVVRRKGVETSILRKIMDILHMVTFVVGDLRYFTRIVEAFVDCLRAEHPNQADLTSWFSKLSARNKRDHQQQPSHIMSHFYRNQHRHQQQQHQFCSQDGSSVANEFLNGEEHVSTTTDLATTMNDATDNGDAIDVPVPITLQGHDDDSNSTNSSRSESGWDDWDDDDDDEATTFSDHFEWLVRELATFISRQTNICNSPTTTTADQQQQQQQQELAHARRYLGIEKTSTATTDLSALVASMVDNDARKIVEWSLGQSNNSNTTSNVTTSQSAEQQQQQPASIFQTLRISIRDDDEIL